MSKSISRRAAVSIQVFSMVSLLCFVFACSSATSSKNGSVSYTTTKMMIDVPKSLTNPSSESASTSIAAVAHRVTMGLSRAEAASSAPESQAYAQLQNHMSVAKNMGSTVAIFGTFSSTMVGQYNLSPSSATLTGKTLRITQELIDAMKSSVPEGMTDESSYPKPGSTMPFPDFVYNTTNQPGYDYVMTMVFPTESGSDTVAVYWNNDRTKVAFVTIHDGFPQAVATDLATKSTAIVLIFEDFKFQIWLRTDTESTNGGVFVRSVSTGDGSYQEVAGYGDNSGGTVVTKYANGSDAYTESFDVDGNMLYQAFNSGSESSISYGEASDERNTDKLNNNDYGEAPEMADAITSN